MAFKFYIGYDNALDWALQVERPNCSIDYYDADQATRFVVQLDDDAGTTIDSAIEPAVFSTTTVLIGSTSVVALRLLLGLANGLIAGTYRMRLIVYSNDYPDGVVWQTNVPIIISE